MKTKTLIELLNKADPSGEEECCVDNKDILFLESVGSYYDGRRQTLIRDENETKYYNVKGVKITGEGTKIQIHTHSVYDFLMCNEDGVVETDNERDKERVEDFRKLMKKIDDDFALNTFVEYCEKRFNKDTLDGKLEKDDAASFWAEHPELNKEFNSIGSSILDKKYRFWDCSVSYFHPGGDEFLKYTCGYENDEY